FLKVSNWNQKDKMKIVYCVNNTWYSGGVTRVLSNKANYLANRGYEVYIITTDQVGKQPRYSLCKKIVCIDLNINYFKSDQLSFLKRLFVFMKSFFKHKSRMQSVLEEINPDVVISLFGRESYILPFVSGKFKKLIE